jgi:hypothetical protein
MNIQRPKLPEDGKWENTSAYFEVFGITTDYVTWATEMYDDVLSYPIENPESLIDKACITFAKKQHAFMLSPTALFGKLTYVAESIVTEKLENIRIDGPLYRVIRYTTDDVSAGKSVERPYIDPVSFEPKYGLWYPQKHGYKIRYGKQMNV